MFGTWRDELERKVAGGQHDLAGELSEGALLLGNAAEQRDRHRGPPADRARARRTLEDSDRARERQARRGARPRAARGRRARASSATAARRCRTPLPIEVDRLRARFGAWYELFPRSWGGLKGVEQQLPRLAELGFDVLYLPPIHPIGLTNRKGRDNALIAAPRRPGLAVGDRRRHRRPRRGPP